LFATIKKELLLLLRDPGGLLLLLIMPAILIIVMAFVQDAPYRDYQEMHFDILVVNKDPGSVGKKILEQLGQSRNFTVVSEVDHKVLDEQGLRNSLRTGKYKMGIIIPANATAIMVNMSNRLANKMAGSMHLPATLPESDKAPDGTIELIFDPVVKPSFRNALSFALNEYITKVKTEVVLQRLSSLNGGDASGISLDNLKGLSVTEQRLDNGERINERLNSVQHNVPAWALFGMFMIVVPISGNMIRERDEGSDVRIKLIPDATRRVGLGKIVFYMLVCLFQFFVMMLVGIFLLPLLGLPQLQLGAHPWLLLPVALAIAFAAVNYGYFIGAVFKTANQAMPFGAISVVLFSAMGGVWVPVDILPPAMRTIALASPLHWGLEGINQVILRGGNFGSVIVPSLVMIGIGMLLTVLPVFFGRR